MLILLQPGIQNLGQFDLKDTFATSIVGGEVGVFAEVEIGVDAEVAAPDVFAQGPFSQSDNSLFGPGDKQTHAVHVTLGSAAASGDLFGFVDEGSATADGKGYGTLYGTVIGASTGQGTGHGAQPGVGTIVIGPNTTTGSGKVTLWTKPGLYGVTVDAFDDAATDYDVVTSVLNKPLYGKAATGKLTLDDTANGVQVALCLGRAKETSLVRTNATQVGATAERDHMVTYLLGVQAAVVVP